MANIQQNIRAQTPQMMTLDDIQQNLRESVTSHFYSLARAFSDVDYAGIGVVSKEDFREVIAKNAFRMSDEQVMYKQEFYVIIICFKSLFNLD